MKVIFLDVDGVLNCETTTDSVGHYIGIEDGKIRLLAKIVRNTNADIVLTSTWKEFWYREENKKALQDDLANHLEDKLHTYGLYVLDKTEDRAFDRGEGILRWNREHDVKQFVILDDNLFDFLEAGLGEHLIRTNCSVGLMAEDADRAIQLLNEESKVDPAEKFYADAVRLTREKGEISPMILQRELKIGYSTALRILERMEAEGVIKKEWEGMKLRYILLQKPKG